MLKYKLIGDILQVTEKIMGWTSTDIKIVEYNIKTWESRVQPDNFRAMTQSSINWVNKYYLPKIKAVCNE